MKVWHDGRVGSEQDCRVSVLDHGLLYGDGVFEGIRITGGRVFRLDDHVQRFEYSARAIGLNLGHDRSELVDIVMSTARAHGQSEAYVRLLATRGIGELGIDPSTCGASELFCIVADLRMFPAAARERGLRVLTSALRRPRGDMLDPQVKSLNYLNNVLAKRDARLKGYDDAVLLNADGRVAEASAANIFAVIDGELVTPPCSEGALAGITRDTVIRCARAAAIGVSLRPLTRYELLNAEEAFVCGSGAGLIALASLDDTAVGGTDRPLLAAMTRAYGDYARVHGTAL